MTPHSITVRWSTAKANHQVARGVIIAITALQLVVVGVVVVAVLQCIYYWLVIKH